MRHSRSNDQGMRVGYVVKRYPRYSETFIVNEILAHEAAGLDVRIFALLPPEDTHFQDVIARVRAPVRYLPARSGKATELWAQIGATARECPQLWQALAATGGETAREALQAMVLAQEIRRQGVTHLHAHFATAATTVARLAASICGIPYSFTAHAKDIFHQDVDMDALRLKFLDAVAAVTVSDYNLDYLRDRMGYAGGRIRRIYNGLDLDRFGYHEPSARPAEIIAVGRLVEKKGFAYLIEACRLLRDNDRNFLCRIIGSGEQEQMLRRIIRAYGLEDQVVLCGPRPQQEVMDALRSAAVFAAPCTVGGDGNRDGLPTVLLEAMALGTPCISTDVTGIPEIIRDGDTGLLVSQQDPVSLAAGIDSLLNSAELRVSLARRARALIEAEFDVHRNAADLRDCFTRAGQSDRSLPAAGAA